MVLAAAIRALCNLELCRGGQPGGALDYLQQHYDLSRVQLHGSSSGALAAVLAASGVDLRHAVQHTARALEEHRVHDR